MANGIKGPEVLAALALLSCGVSASSRSNQGDSVPAVTDDILSLSMVVSRNKLTYGNFVSNKGEINNNRYVEINGKSAHVFEYNSLGYCSAVDNSRDIGDDDPSKRRIFEFRCSLPGSKTPLSVVARRFGRIYLATPAIDDMRSLQEAESLSIPPGYHAYRLGFEEPAAAGVSLEIVVLTDRDLFEETRRTGSYPILRENLLLDPGRSITIKRVIFHVGEL